MRALAVAFAALALAAPSLGANGGRVSESAIETQLVCPVCHETLDQSTAPVAQEMKREIRRRIAEGWTEKQIMHEMVVNFGQGVLSTPSKHGFDLLAWVLPIGGILLGAAALGAGAWYWSRPKDPPSTAPAADGLTPEDELLVDRELARFE